jgi:hypothetical protein
MVGWNVKPPTVKQLANRRGMKVVIEFLKPGEDIAELRQNIDILNNMYT